MDDADGTPASPDGEPTTWTDLFDRAARYDVDEPTVREALARSRERADE